MGTQKTPSSVIDLATEVKNAPDAHFVKTRESKQYWLEWWGPLDWSAMDAMFRRAGWAVIAHGRGLRAWADSRTLQICGAFDRDVCMEVFADVRHFKHAVALTESIDFRKFHVSPGIAQMLGTKGQPPAKISS